MENTDMEYSVTLFNAYISEIGNYSHYGWKQTTTFCTQGSYISEVFGHQMCPELRHTSVCPWLLSARSRAWLPLGFHIETLVSQAALRL